MKVVHGIVPLKKISDVFSVIPIMNRNFFDEKQRLSTELSNTVETKL